MVVTYLPCAFCVISPPWSLSPLAALDTEKPAAPVHELEPAKVSWSFLTKTAYLPLRTVFELVEKSMMYSSSFKIPISMAELEF